jgi:hypothetical protein
MPAEHPIRLAWLFLFLFFYFLSFAVVLWCTGNVPPDIICCAVQAKDDRLKELRSAMDSTKEAVELQELRQKVDEQARQLIHALSENKQASQSLQALKNKEGDDSEH